MNFFGWFTRRHATSQRKHGKRRVKGKATAVQRCPTVQAIRAVQAMWHAAECRKLASGEWQ